ncbi:MAG: glucosaminidase domain-containing protein [Saprospiraceae bacterium]
MIDYRFQRRESTNSILKPIFAAVEKYWFQAAVVLLLYQLYANKGTIVYVNPNQPVAASALAPAEKVMASIVSEEGAPAPVLVEDRPAVVPNKWSSSDFKNLSFVLDPGMAARKGVPDAIVQEKLQACRSYVERFAATAMSEMKTYGIPASITLAQGLIETNAGDSKLASESNNHFGIKCRSKCRGCTCRNYSDDDVYDMFRVFDTAWESFREHSKLLQIDRYKKLKKYGTKDYKSWATGLKKAGYATDKNYDAKLIQLIEELDLWQFDK